MDSSGSSRLRPYADPNNAVKITFQKGEKVEAIWSTDGQKYPGTIVHVYPNDNYEVLFDDGVKSRKKPHQIFKKLHEAKKRHTRFLSKNLLPSAPAVPVTLKPKPLPALIPVKAVLGAQASSGLSGDPGPPTLKSCNSNNERSDSQSSSRLPPSPSPPPPLLLPAPPLPTPSALEETGISSTTPSPSTNNNNSTKAKTSSNSSAKSVRRSNSINSKPISNSMPDDPGGTGGGGSASPNPVTSTSAETSSAASSLSTKKGFVYVQQPHYSVFDIVPTDLGKRPRRVHNYSRLAKGPPLKGGTVGAFDGLLDGECISQPASPASSASTGRSSPLEPVVGAPVSNRRKRSSTAALVNNIHNSVKKLTPNRTSNSRTDVKPDEKVPEESSEPLVTESPVPPPPPPKSVSRGGNRKRISSVCDNDKSVLTAATTITKTIVTQAQPKINSIEPVVNNSINVTGVPLSDKIEHLDSEAPSKRLRKPSTRFSAEEGYIDVFSSKRTKRTTLSPNGSSSPRVFSRPSPSNSNSDIKPKLQVQRPRSKSNSSKKGREMEPPPPVLFPETESVKSDEMDTSESEVVNSDHPTTVAPPQTSPIKDPIVLDNEEVNHVSSEEEELLDVGIYTVIQPLPSPKKKRPSRISVSESKTEPECPSVPPPPSSSPVVVTSSSPPISPKKNEIVPDQVLTPKKSPTSSKTTSPESSKTTSPEDLILRRRRGRRWTMPSKPERPERPIVDKVSTTEILPAMPSVVLNRLSIGHVQIVVEKCDSLHSSLSASKSLQPATPDDKADEVNKVNSEAPPEHTELTEPQATETPSESDPVVPKVLTSNARGSRKRIKRWGENKNRWTKPRHKPGSLLPGMRPGIRLKDSLSMQLLKRSRLQRRFEKRGRPKVALLSGITKKKLRKIQESIQNRKLKKTRCSVATKFKDVRVDIINCICGRTDEFGLMIQCEVCLCWQHGGCFRIHDSSRLPKFYVCQSCKCPKSVRPSGMTEAVRQESYRKGVLPFYPFAPKPSTRKQKILKLCNELSKVIDRIDDSIRQNKIKEHIALTEPEHPKLYQWSAQRPSPKDQIQKWNFNKYFKSILRRLMHRHRRNPAYLDKLTNIINFRDKLKKYSQAFEEARLAIRRKIGPRGLILIEKLCEHQRKIEKIKEAKWRYDPTLRKQPTQSEGASITDPLTSPPAFPPPPSRENEEKIGEKKSISNSANKTKSEVVWTEKLERLMARHAFLSNEISSFDSDDSDFEEEESDSSDEKQTNLSPSDSPDLQNSEGETVSAQEKELIPLDPNITIKEERVDVEDCKVSEELKEGNVCKTQILGQDTPGVSLVNGFSKGDSPRDLESEEPVEDIPDGEEYLLQPQTDIIKKYQKYRNFLLTEDLESDKQETNIDDLYIPTRTDAVSKDWLWDFDGELGIEMEDSDSSITDSESEESNSENETSTNFSSEDEENIQNEQPCLKYWQKDIMSTSNETEDLEEEDWQVEGASEEVSSSETDEDSATEDDGEMLSSSVKKKLNHPDIHHNRVADGSPRSGVLLVTNDPEAVIGETVDVTIKVGSRYESLGKGEVVAGAKGQNFIRFHQTSPGLDTQPQEMSSPGDSPLGPTKSRISLCKACRESVGSKWTWDEVDSGKGIEVVCEDTILSYLDELKKFYTLGLWSAKSNVEVDLNKPCRPLHSNLDSRESRSSSSKFSSFQPKQLKDICREAVKISKSQASKNALVQDSPNANAITAKPPRSIPPTSAEEESILSLLSLSKTPVQFNGENVSELSIESLRRLTDQLQCNNGPLTEGLAKAVGQPLVNGKVNLQNCQNTAPNSKPMVGMKNPLAREAVCVRCSLKGKQSKVLTILSTLYPELAKDISEDELLTLHKELSEAVTKVRASAHVIKRAVFKKVSVMVERMKAERIARAKGEEIIPISAQGNLALTRPEEYLHGLKSEYVDALLPYATYFISRFTKRDELNKAKKCWVQDMIEKYILVRKSLKDMYGTNSEESRIVKEDKFYTALDNLRKSFDIVLTKKDIKMRRQNQNSESSTSTLLGPNGIRPDVKRALENSKSSLLPNLVNGDLPEPPASTPPEGTIETLKSADPLPLPKCMDKFEVADPYQFPGTDVDFRLLGRLGGLNTIQNEDVDSLLRLTSEDIEGVVQGPESMNGKKDDLFESKVSDSNDTSIPDKTVNGPSEPEPQLTNGQADLMEIDQIDDMKMLEENLALKTSDNLVIGGDMDLINAIGTFGGETENAEDSDLLLNVFDDPAFSEPQDDPKPCCSKSLTSLPPPLPKQIAPVLQKLTPEMCRGFLVEDIRAHQQIVDVQLDRVESEIMELERRRGKGLKEKEDDRLFSKLYSNMQLLIDNLAVLDRVLNQNIGEDDPEVDQSESEDEDDEDEEEGEEEEGREGGTGSTTESSPSSDKEEIDEVDVDLDTDDSSNSEDHFEMD